MTISIYDPYPIRSYAIIKNTKIFLNLPDDHIVTYNDVEKLKSIIFNYINIDNLSPSQIAKKYKIQYSDFGSFITKSLKIQLKSLKNSVINYYVQNNKEITDKKRLYWNKCKFSFNPYKEKNIIGYNFLYDYKFFSKSNNNTKVCIHKDHMISISYGWENNIPPEHISHPANCEIMLDKDNIRKNSSCSISYEELLKRINNWNNNNSISKIYIPATRSSQHKQNISKSITEWHKNKNNNTDIDNLLSMEFLLETKGIDEASNILGITTKQFKDKLRYRRNKYNR